MEEPKWGNFETPESYNKKIESAEQSDPLASVRIKPTKNNDKQLTIFDYVEKENIFEKYRIREENKSWIEKKIDQAGNLKEDNPGIFWTSIGAILLIFVFMLIKLVWKLVKLVLYQITYTITKAIKDGSSSI